MSDITPQPPPRATDDFWRPLIHTDGALDETKILNELADYKFLLDNVPQVYMAISNGKLSKPNYPASVMVGEFEQTVIDAVAEETEELEKKHKTTIAALEARLAMQREGAAADTELLNWLDRKDRSAHQDGDHWAIWLDTSKEGDPITTVGDLRTALRAARAAELEGQ